MKNRVQEDFTKLHLNSLWTNYSWSKLLDPMELKVMLKKYGGLGIHRIFERYPRSSSENLQEGFTFDKTLK
jgi:hypothetical protein